MIKSIETLIPDIYEVIKGKGGWDAAVTEFLKERIASVAEDRFSKEQKVRDYISPSNLGSPCGRKLWYIVNQPNDAEPLTAEALGTFFYGDLLEQLVISLAIAAGHRVDGLQEPLDIAGLSGSGDCIIDGVVVDVKSASKFGFTKFQKNNLKEDDPFGYISQLSSYLYGYKDDPRVVTKNAAAFLVVQKDRFKLCLDWYNLEKELEQKEQEVQAAKELVAGPLPPRGFDDTPDGKSGNRKLAVGCSYCQFKHTCWPDIRTFIYSTGPTYLTKVVKLPKVPEVDT